MWLFLVNGRSQDETVRRFLSNVDWMSSRCGQALNKISHRVGQCTDILYGHELFKYLRTCYIIEGSAIFSKRICSNLMVAKPLTKWLTNQPIVIRLLPYLFQSIRADLMSNDLSSSLVPCLWNIRDKSLSFPHPPSELSFSEILGNLSSVDRICIILQF